MRALKGFARRVQSRVQVRRKRSQNWAGNVFLKLFHRRCSTDYGGGPAVGQQKSCTVISRSALAGRWALFPGPPGSFVISTQQ